MRACRQISLRNRARLNPNRIVDRIPQPLFASQVTFRCLDTGVPEQELNLLQFTAALVAQSGARAAEVVRGHVRKVAG